MGPEVLSGAFAQPPVDAAHSFRAVMQAMARPGSVHKIEGAAPPQPLSPAAGAVLLTLCDADTPLHLAGAVACDSVRAWVTFHTGSPLVERHRAAFAVGAWGDLGGLAEYPQGSAEYPDRSATLIVEMDALVAHGATLTGPGIRETAALQVPDVAALQANHALFPLGLDFMFTCGDRVAALPRSTEIS